ncbi:MAG: hypothetical protein P1Q69_16270, partial [Candidatus Thorarchaeota archaeon]|nr:hypothetical protein [Candidatus Thorarchaeota archaeon]
NTTNTIVSVDISTDGSTIIAANTNQLVLVFDYSSNQTLWENQFMDTVGKVSVCRNGTYLAVGSQEGTFLFPRSSNVSLWSSINEFDTVQISEDARTIAATNSESNTDTLFVWDSGSNETLWKYNGTERFTTLAMNEAGTRIIAGGYGNETMVFDRNSNTSIIRHPCESYIIDVAITSDGNEFATSCGDGHTYYFSLTAPTFNNVTTDKEFYNTLENPIIWAEIQKGTTDLIDCILWYSSDGTEWNSKVMDNETPLADSVITFSTTFDSLSSNITFYATTHDKLEYVVSSAESNIIFDNLCPLILDPIQYPIAPTSSDAVTINVTVTDSLSGVQSVLLHYISSSSEVWIEEEMADVESSVYSANIPEFPNGTVIQYFFEAFDSVDNKRTNNNSGSYFEYTVFDESTSSVTSTPSPTTPTQPADPLSLLYVVALIAGITVGMIVIVAYIFHRKRRVGEDTTPTISATSEDE